MNSELSALTWFRKKGVGVMGPMAGLRIKEVARLLSEAWVRKCKKIGSFFIQNFAMKRGNVVARGPPNIYGERLGD